MSVAFRRESDEEHLEPKFELPIPLGPNLVTPRGLELIEARNAELEAAVAAASAEALPELQRDLRYWRARLATAQLAPPASGEIVAFGTAVTIEQDGKARTLAIVGHDESDPAAGRIAFTAPLAKVLIGNEVGEEVDPPGPGGAITIVAIAVA
ncbi:GreA/GreB family elongation factor [Sphingomonas sp.]|uniref:GreA/GreB family elongation factor n=1 Tax=Sphingomonas sp. TaxID=28214 RepID=UPI00286C7324|nr:GreA/GreB family elongation factor [Sphingomonas sp.]